MKMRLFCLFFLALATCSAFADSLTVTITVDNGYGFGFGDVNGIYSGQYYGGVDNCTAGQVLDSHCYVFQSPDGTGCIQRNLQIIREII
jgi:hypothetical protein